MRNRDRFANGRVHAICTHARAGARRSARAGTGCARHRHARSAPASATVPEAVSVFIAAPSMAELEHGCGSGRAMRRATYSGVCCGRARDRGLEAMRPHHQPGREGRLRSARGHHPGRALSHRPSETQVPGHGGLNDVHILEVLEGVNRYLLVVLAAKRARQLSRGAQDQVEHRQHQPTSVSLEDRAGQVGYRVKDDDAPKDRRVGGPDE